mgnify:CR=1 FL=1
MPEDDIPRAVDHLGRTTEVFRLMANQWTVLETLTPQGFLAFRDELGSASGFESFQMREFEILLGLENEDRIGGMDPISRFRRMALLLAWASARLDESVATIRARGRSLASASAMAPLPVPRSAISTGESAGVASSTACTRILPCVQVI